MDFNEGGEVEDAPVEEKSSDKNEDFFVVKDLFNNDISIRGLEDLVAQSNST